SMPRWPEGADGDRRDGSLDAADADGGVATVDDQHEHAVGPGGNLDLPVDELKGDGFEAFPDLAVFHAETVAADPAGDAAEERRFILPVLAEADVGQAEALEQAFLFVLGNLFLGDLLGFLLGDLLDLLFGDFLG